LGVQKFGDLVVEIVDSVKDYVSYMKEIYDFEVIRTYRKENPSFKVLIDAMHGGEKILFVLIKSPGHTLKVYS
jgi:phosphoglucomutase